MCGCLPAVGRCGRACEAEYPFRLGHTLTGTEVPSRRATGGGGSPCAAGRTQLWVVSALTRGATTVPGSTTTPGSHRCAEATAPARGVGRGSWPPGLRSPGGCGPVPPGRPGGGLLSQPGEVTGGRRTLDGEGGQTHQRPVPARRGHVAQDRHRRRRRPRVEDDVVGTEPAGVCLLYTSPSPRDRTRT